MQLSLTSFAHIGFIQYYFNSNLLKNSSREVKTLCSFYGTVFCIVPKVRSQIMGLVVRVVVCLSITLFRKSIQWRMCVKGMLQESCVGKVSPLYLVTHIFEDGSEQSMVLEKGLLKGTDTVRTPEKIIP